MMVQVIPDVSVGGTLATVQNNAFVRVGGQGMVLTTPACSRQCPPFRALLTPTTSIWHRGANSQTHLIWQDNAFTVHFRGATTPSKKEKQNYCHILLLLNCVLSVHLCWKKGAHGRSAHQVRLHYISVKKDIDQTSVATFGSFSLPLRPFKAVQLFFMTG